MSASIIQIDTKSAKPKSGRKLKTMLLFPPEWVPTAPYLALPSLTAVLRENGHEVIQRDINIEMYELFFSDMFLIWVNARMAQQLREIKAKESREGLSEKEIDQKVCLEEALSFDVMELATNAEEANASIAAKIFMMRINLNGP